MGSAYLQSLRDTAKRYKIVKFDKGTQTITLRSPLGVVFDITPFNKEVATKNGYKLEQANE